MALIKSKKKDVLCDIRWVRSSYVQQNFHGSHVNLVIARDNTDHIEADLCFLYHVACDLC